MKFKQVNSKTTIKMSCEECGTVNTVSIKTYDLLMRLYSYGHKYFFCIKCGEQIRLEW